MTYIKSTLQTPKIARVEALEALAEQAQKLSMGYENLSKMKTYTVKIDEKGIKRWYFNDKIHREDGPALEYPNGTKCWYLNGKLHRKDGPAIEWEGGDKNWYLNGELHRCDGPAIESVNGYKLWYINGILLPKKSSTHHQPAHLNEDNA